MTQGNPLKLILSFALPLLIGNLLQQTYNIIDAAIVGRFLGSDALAAVGASSSVQFLVLGFCIGTTLGFGVPIARHFGAGDLKKLKECFYNSILLTAAFAALLTTVCALLCNVILKALSTPANIHADAYKYLLVIFLGIPFTLLYNLLSSVLRSVGDSKTPFVFLAISTVLNIGLDLLFVVAFRWGCSGAAIATVLAQAISGILCAIFITRKVKVLQLSREDRNIHGNTMLNLIIMGVPMGLQYSITAIGSMVMQSANNKLGSIYVSGFTAASRIKQFTMCPYDAFATGASVFASQNLGAGNLDRIKKGIRIGVAVGVLYGLFAGLVLIFFGRRAFDDLCQQGGRCGAGRFGKIPFLRRLFLLDAGNTQHLQNVYAGSWLFGTCGVLGRDGNDRTNCRKYDVCRQIRLYGYLLHRSGGLGIGLYLHSADMYFLREQGRTFH